jgi:hypothetical protein
LLNQTVIRLGIAGHIYLYLKEADFNSTITVPGWNFELSFYESEWLNQHYLAGYDILRTVSSNPMITIVWTKYDSHYFTRHIGAYLHQYRNGKHLIVLDDDMRVDDDYLLIFVRKFEEIRDTQMFTYFGRGLIIPADRFVNCIPAVEFLLRSVILLVNEVRRCRNLLFWDEWILRAFLFGRGKHYPDYKYQRRPRGIRGIPNHAGTTGAPTCGVHGRGFSAIRTKITSYFVNNLNSLYAKNTTDRMPEVVQEIKTHLMPSSIREWNGTPDTDLDV